jgi:hypothetical protein
LLLFCYFILLLVYFDFIKDILTEEEGKKKKMEKEKGTTGKRKPHVASIFK